jgi:hypothetical protein
MPRVRLGISMAAAAAILWAAPRMAAGPEPGRPSAWFSPRKATVTLVSGAGAPRANLSVEALAPAGDSAIVLETGDGTRSSRVEMYVIGNRYWLVRGVVPTQGYELETLNEPVLTMQLVLTLLDWAAPGGPAAVPKPTPVHRKELIRTITVEALGSSGRYPPPLALDGTLSPDGDRRIHFDLRFATEPEGRRQVLSLSGEWDGAPMARHLSDEMEIDDFRVYALDARRNAEGTVIDQGARRITGVRTIGELRGR